MGLTRRVHLFGCSPVASTGRQLAKLATCFENEQIKARVYQEPVFEIFG
jgi:hypothetical protein